MEAVREEFPDEVACGMYGMVLKGAFNRAK